MASVQVTLKVSPLAYQELTRVKQEMTADATREVTYSEVIERLARAYEPKAVKP